MPRTMFLLGVLVLFCTTGPVAAADDADLKALLGRPIIGQRQTLLDIQDYTEPRIPRLPAFETVAEWENYADRLRAAILEQVVFRGEAAAWRNAKTRVEWLGTLDGGPGYRIRKLRYEALPGLWIPALLYEPDKLTGKVPVVLNVNGHDPKGKAAPYKQLRCINLAKRGMLALNVEWLFMGQLRTEGFRHYRMNQLDLCGSSGLAPFFLAMQRGLDVLLALEHADPERLAVTGLSGGGWQTIFLSALDTRVKLANPVAGYGSFRTNLRFFDVGDSEQSPCDLARLADYTHLTALLAPRPTLLTYNAKDDCCFQAGHALPPLLEAASPIYKLYGKEQALRSHINHDPGTHNYEQDNRQAFYRMVGDHFFAGRRGYNAQEIPSAAEVKSADDLFVELPAKTVDFQSLALEMSRKLPRSPDLPADPAAARQWQEAGRKKLRELVQAKDYSAQAEKAGSDRKGNLEATFWKLRIGDAWTVPVVELVRGEAKMTAVVVADEGRRSTAATVERLLAAGYRVLVVDPLLLGESKTERHPTPFALLVDTIGDRPLGLQASQLAAVARWATTQHRNGPVTLVAVGPRSSMMVLVAGAMGDAAIGRLELHGALGSLKELIEQNQSVERMPEMFCFGLLGTFDVKQIAALAAPRPVVFVAASERAKKELAGLKSWYAALGSDFEPSR